MIRSSGRLRLCAVLIALNLAFIWGNSLLPGEVSGALSDWVRALLAAIWPGEGPVTSGGGLLRKIAHFSEFALLGGLLSWLFSMLRRHPGWAFLCGFLTACVDETIQRFVPDRGPSLFDVGIDTCGVATGMLLIFIGHTVWKKQQNPLEDK